MTELIKSAASAVVALTVLGGAASAVIVAFGGRIPPYVTPAEAASIVDRLDGIARVVEGMQKKQERDACDDWNRRLANALDRIAARPPPAERELLETIARDAAARIRETPGCLAQRAPPP